MHQQLFAYRFPSIFSKASNQVPISCISWLIRISDEHNEIRIGQPTAVNSAKPVALHIALWIFLLPYPPLAAHTEQSLVSFRPYTLCSRPVYSTLTCDLRTSMSVADSADPWDQPSVCLRPTRSMRSNGKDTEGLHRHQTV